MSTVDTHHRHTTPWIASAAAACILAAAGVAGVAWQQHKGEASPSAPGTPSVVTYPLQNYPHLAHAWRIHHAQSLANAEHSQQPTTSGGKVQTGE
jgi:hypothetical protein